jgi:hypothetical protein
VEYDNGDIHINLVSAKSRLAPIKEFTIPRLELEGAKLGANAHTTLCKDLAA